MESERKKGGKKEKYNVGKYGKEMQANDWWKAPLDVNVGVHICVNKYACI